MDEIKLQAKIQSKMSLINEASENLWEFKEDIILKNGSIIFTGDLEQINTFLEGVFFGVDAEY